MNIRLIYFLCLLIISAGFYSCKPDDDLSKVANPKWKPEVAVPLVNAEIRTDEIIDKLQNDSLIEENATGFLTLVYRGTVFSNQGDVEIDIPDQAFSHSFSIPPLEIADFNIGDTVTLGQVAENLNEPERTQILSNHGTSQQFPGIPAQSAGSFPYNSSDQFQSLTFQSGILQLTIQNNLPVILQDVSISLIDNNTNTTVANFFFPVIFSDGAMADDTASVAGKTISDNLRVSIDSIGTPGSTSPVLIDTTDEVIFTLNGQDLVVQQGTAVIPEQDDPIGADTISFSFPNGEEMTLLKLKSGILEFLQNYSDFSNAINVTIRLPYFTRNGVPFDEKFPINDNQTFNIGGYEFDFTSGGAFTNTAILEYNLDSDGDMVTFSSGDSLNFSLSTRNMELGYAEGYFGTQTFELERDTISINIYKNWKSGSIYFENPQLDVIINNSYGLPITAQFNQLFAKPKESPNDTIGFNGPFVSAPETFNFPSLAEVGTHAETIIELNKNNSNIAQIIASSPVEIQYALNASSNPGGVTYDNFVTDSSYFSADVDLRLPLHGRLEGVVLQDTFGLQTGALENIEFANFSLVTENAYPVNIDMQFYFTDENHQVIDSLMSSLTEVFSSGKIDDNGRVVSPTKKITKVPYEAKRLANVKNATFIILKVRLNTTENPADNDNIKIYSDYFIKVNLGVISKLSP